MEVDKTPHLEVIPKKYWRRFEKNEEKSPICRHKLRIPRALRKTLIEGKKKRKTKNTKIEATIYISLINFL